MGWRIGSLGAGAADAGGDLQRPLEVLHVHDPVAGDEVLGLGERPVGHHRWTLASETTSLA